MKISEFEKKVELSRDTLRYYERIGILTPPSRGSNGYRFYGKTQLKELAFIEKGKAIGFTLTAIGDAYKRFQELGHFCPEFTLQLSAKKAMFSQRIKDDKQAIKEIDKLLN